AARPTNSRTSRKTPDCRTRTSLSRFHEAPMSSRVRRRADLRRLAASSALAVALARAAAVSTRTAEKAERDQDFDRAVIEYTKVVRANPDDRTARLSLERARQRAAQEHFFRARRLAASQRFEEALVEYQLASELNPSDSQVDAALRETRQKLRAKLAITHAGQTELQALIERSRAQPVTGFELPKDLKLPDSLVFSNASTRAVFLAIARFANVNVVFDSTFREAPLTIDLRNVTLEDALTSLTAATHTFYRMTAPMTIAIVPDTQAKRREYEETFVKTVYLSNADIKEVIDLLRVVVDVRQISPITAINAVSLKDTPERIAAAERLIEAIDKARPEVVIDVELLEVDRTRLREYGLQVASPPGSPTVDGISGSADVNRPGFTLQNLTNLTQADVLLS